MFSACILPSCFFYLNTFVVDGLYLCGTLKPTPMIRASLRLKQTGRSAWAILIHSSEQHGGLGFCRRTLWSTATGRDWTSDPAISEQPALPPEPTSPLLIKCLQNGGCSVDTTRCRKPVYWKSKGVNSIGLALSKVHLLFAPPKNNHRWKVHITPHGVCVWRQLDC